MTRLPWGAGVWFGGDYNPEQWDAEIHAADDALMRRARVNTATVGVFSWSCLEPEEGRYDFGWLDATLDRLHAAGVQVVLATPTASPPPWFSLAHPEALPVTPDGVRLVHGSRDTYCAAAPAYRTAALRIAGALADRYADHPALAMWHVHNEYGTLCWCDLAAGAFRRWLQHRYGPGDDGLAAVNLAWNTAFWSQRYSAWEQVLPPRATQYLHNPSQTLDFRRFWSDELLAAYREQRDALRRRTPAVPITTNFMLPTWQNLDLWRWSREVDVVAVDHYLDSAGPDGEADVAFGADRARSLNGGRPWVLMEQATSMVYLPGLMVTKEPGRMLRNSLGYLARGSDSVLFFQWRAGRTGSELHHAAMVPHAGPDTRVFREVEQLGAVLERLGEVCGSRVAADVAIVWDADSWWATDNGGFPSSRLGYLEALREVHRALWRAGVVADVVEPDGDLAGYRAVLAPSLYLVDAARSAALSAYVAGGGHLLLGCFSGVAGADGRVHLGGFPGGLREVTGVRVEEFHPLPDDAGVELAGADPFDGMTGRLWSEDLRAEAAEVVASYRGGVLDGHPAITRNGHGAGVAWYCSTRPDAASLGRLLARVLAGAGVQMVPRAGAGPVVETVRRRSDDGRSWLFVLNHTAEPARVPARGVELVSGEPVPGEVEVPAGGVAVIRETS